MNPFADYAAQVDQGRRNRPAPLTGPITTRAQARVVYARIVAELQACEDADTLDIYLMTVGEELLQFQRELDFLWEGDGEDFPGLNREIAAAKERTSNSEFQDASSWKPAHAGEAHAHHVREEGVRK